jgi:putative phosphoesterase
VCRTTSPPLHAAAVERKEDVETVEIVRVAVISDIHGNLTALEAVMSDLQHRGVDRVLHGGDLVLMGAQPAEVIDRVRELGWPGVLGNTDEVLWRPEVQARQQRLAPKLSPLLNLIFNSYAPATLELIGDERLSWLRRLPVEQRLADIALLHAAPGDLWRAPTPESTDVELEATYSPLGAGMAVYGHIHRPFVRTLAGSFTIANSGSVGLPWDGDQRAAYLLFDNGRTEVIRVAYDIERETALLLKSGYPDAARLTEMRRRGAFIRPARPSP